MTPSNPTSSKSLASQGDEVQALAAADIPEPGVLVAVSVFDKIRADVDAEDFGVSVEFAYRAEEYAKYCVTRALSARAVGRKDDLLDEWSDRTAEAQAERDAAREERDELLKDAARLDWLTQYLNSMSANEELVFGFIDDGIPSCSRRGIDNLRAALTTKDTQ